MSAFDPMRTLAKPGLYLRDPDRSSIAALAGLAGALSTAVQASGKSLSFNPRDEPPNSGIFKRRIESANQWSSDLSHHHHLAQPAARDNPASRRDTSGVHGCGQHGHTRDAPWTSTLYHSGPRRGRALFLSPH